MDSFVEKSKLLVELLRKEANGKTTFNIFPYITNCTLDIIAGNYNTTGVKFNLMIHSFVLYV